MERNQANHQQQGEIYRLTDTEKIWLGLKTPEKIPGTVRVAFPEHYGSAAVMWRTKWIQKSQVDAYRAKYPEMQVIEERRLKRK